MRSRIGPLRTLTLSLGILLVAVACGGGEGESDGGDVAAPGDIPQGGTLTMAGTSDVDYMDYGQSYYTLGASLFRGVVRTLVTYPGVPDVEAQAEVVPDLATDTGQSNE